MRTTFLAVLSAGLLVAAAPVVEAGKGKKPRLEVRASPRMAFSPVSVLITAELVGGDDLESFHCPEIEWEWDDGGKSVHEADCEPLAEGGAIQRRFTSSHEYRRAGEYTVKVTMRRSQQRLAQATVRVTVRPGVGDPTFDE